MTAFYDLNIKMIVLGKLKKLEKSSFLRRKLLNANIKIKPQNSKVKH